MDVKADEENRLNAFEMKSLRQVLRVSWTARKTNSWVMETAEVERDLLKSVKRRKMAYFGHVMRKDGECLEKEIIQERLLGQEDVADQRRPGSATSCHGPDLESMGQIYLVILERKLILNYQQKLRFPKR